MFSQIYAHFLFIVQMNSFICMDCLYRECRRCIYHIYGNGRYIDEKFKWLKPLDVI